MPQWKKGLSICCKSASHTGLNKKMLAYSYCVSLHSLIYVDLQWVWQASLLCKPHQHSRWDSYHPPLLSRWVVFPQCILKLLWHEVGYRLGVLLSGCSFLLHFWLVKSLGLVLLVLCPDQPSSQGQRLSGVDINLPAVEDFCFAPEVSDTSSPSLSVSVCTGLHHHDPATIPTQCSSATESVRRGIVLGQDYPEIKQLLAKGGILGRNQHCMENTTFASDGEGNPMSGSRSRRGGVEWWSSWVCLSFDYLKFLRTT